MQVDLSNNIPVMQGMPATTQGWGWNYEGAMKTSPSSTSSLSDDNYFWAEQALFPEGIYTSNTKEPSQENTSARSSVSEDWLSHEQKMFGEPDVMSEISTSKPQVHSVPKRTRKLTATQKEAHNQIEKKYRVAINEKIVRLKELLPDGCDNSSKMNKSSILEKVHDYIIQLQETQEDLYNENLALRQQVL